jgi:hypothetical protein
MSSRFRASPGGADAASGFGDGPGVEQQTDAGVLFREVRFA